MKAPELVFDVTVHVHDERFKRGVVAGLRRARRAATRVNGGCWAEDAIRDEEKRLRKRLRGRR